jgi:hypothetical protein
MVTQRLKLKFEIMKHKTNVAVAIFLVVLMAGIMLISCDKDNDAPIQLGYTNIFIRPNSTEFIQLNTVGGWVYLTGGILSRGILVYRLSTDEFKAYERTPTYKPDSCCVYSPEEKCAKVIVEESGIIVKDTCSGSRYLILDGSIVEGPAKYSLLQYRTNYDGDILHIYN